MRTLLILAAGHSRRYGRPKALVPLGPSGETLIDYAVFDAMRSGFTDVAIVTQPEIQLELEKHLRRLWPSLVFRFAHQEAKDVPQDHAILPGRSRPWGTGHAVWAARHIVDTDFVAINCDDFYGLDAYRLAATFFEQNRDGYGLVGYKLADTLTPSGGVSRAVCQIADKDVLEGLEEVLDVRRDQRRILGTRPDGQPVSLNGKETISLNFWIFRPTVFEHLEAGFGRFLDSGPTEDAEFYLSDEIGRLIHRSDITVRVLPTTARWFGITRPADLEQAVLTLSEMIRSGDYPADVASLRGDT